MHKHTHTQHRHRHRLHTPLKNSPPPRPRRRRPDRPAALGELHRRRQHVGERLAPAAPLVNRVLPQRRRAGDGHGERREERQLVAGDAARADRLERQPGRRRAVAGEAADGLGL